MNRRQYIAASGGVTAAALGANVRAEARQEENDGEEWPEFIPEEYDPDPYDFEGEGSEIREGVDIAGGITIVQAAYDGPEFGNFIVEFVPEDGEFGELFQNQLEPYEGSRASVVEAGTYILDVEADGPWTIEIYQPRAESGESVPQDFEGESDRVRGPFEFGGSHVAGASHAGEGNFIVEALPMESGAFGGIGELVFNEIGQIDGAETAFQFEGIGWVSVQADGEWTFGME